MKQVMIVAASLLAGFFGGVFGSRFAIASGPHPATVVRAHTFELVDGAGRALSIWGVDRNGHTRLAFLGSESMPESEGVLKEHALGLDNESNQRAVIGVGGGTIPFLTFRGEDGKDRFNVSLAGWSRPVLAMMDETGPRVWLGFNLGDTPSPKDADAWGLGFEPRQAGMGMSSRMDGNQRYLRAYSFTSPIELKFPNTFSK